jgi:signal peptidase I
MSESPSEVDDTSAALRSDGQEGLDGALPTGTGPITPTDAASHAVSEDSAEAERASSDGRGRHYRRRSQRALLSWLVVLIVAGSLAVALRLYVVQTFFVPSSSMVPTLQVGDRMLVLKVGYTIDRGSILVFRQPPLDTSDPYHEDLVKRVIGLPGDTIWSVANTVYIDGKPLREPWLPKNTVLGPSIRRQTVPAGDYFMMGDNRSDSLDSRDWGVLQRGLIVGEVIVVIWRHGGPVFHIQ